MIRTHAQTADNFIALSMVTVLPLEDWRPTHCDQNAPSPKLNGLPSHPARDAFGADAAWLRTCARLLATDQPSANEGSRGECSQRAGKE